MSSDQTTCFLSYSSRDGDFASSLSEALNQRGLSVWFAPKDIYAGDFFADRIVPAIRQARLFLLLCSHYSTGQSPHTNPTHVLRELTLADQYRLRIVPLLIDDSYFNALPDTFRYFLADKQYLDLRDSVALGKPALAADQIMAGVNNPERPRDDLQLLASAEQSLKQGDHQSAKDILDAVSNRQVYRARLLALATSMQRRPLASQPLDTVTEWVATLQALAAKDRTEIPYLLAALSSYYFEQKAYYDPTGGLQVLASMVGAGKVQTSFRMIVDHIVPAGQNFALLWKSVMIRRRD